MTTRSLTPRPDELAGGGARRATLQSAAARGDLSPDTARAVQRDGIEGNQAGPPSVRHPACPVARSQLTRASVAGRIDEEAARWRCRRGM